jgi:hypothetical protein
MTTITTPSSLTLMPSLKTAWQDVDSLGHPRCTGRETRGGRGLGPVTSLLLKCASAPPIRRVERRVMTFPRTTWS